MQARVSIRRGTDWRWLTGANRGFPTFESTKKTKENASLHNTMPPQNFPFFSEPFWFLITPMNTHAEHYIDLLKKCLSFSLWDAPLYIPFHLGYATPPEELVQCDQALRQQGFCLAKELPYRPEVPLEGADIPYLAHTMIGMARLNNFQFCIEQTIRDNIPGDIIETGVWRGGSCILARAVLRIHAIKDKSVWVADSFQGLPPPDPENYPADKGELNHENSFLRVSQETVENNFRKFGMLDGQVRFLKGWFKETLPRAPIERLSVLRMDGDMYESTMDALNPLYDKVSVGGFIIVDDYSGLNCQQAVTDFRRNRKIEDEIIPIDSRSVYWRRTK